MAAAYEPRATVRRHEGKPCGVWRQFPLRGFGTLRRLPADIAELGFTGWAVPHLMASGPPRPGAIGLVSCLTIDGMLGKRHLRPRSQATRRPIK